MEQLNDSGFIYNYFPAVTEVKALTVIMHGHGSNIKSWEERCRQWQSVMPSMAVIALQAPHEIEGAKNKDGEKMYEWVPMSNPLNLGKSFLSHIFGRLDIAAKVNKFVAAKMTGLGLKEDKVCLIGSSAGGIFALQSAFSSPAPYGAVLGMATTVLPFSRIKTKPDIYMAIGDRDGIFKRDDKISHLSLQFNSAIARLHRGHIKTDTHIYNNVRHTINDEMWLDAAKYAAGKMGIGFTPDKMVFSVSAKPTVI